MKTKTLQDFKDEVAKESTFNDVPYMDYDNLVNKLWGTEYVGLVLLTHDAAAERYALHVAEQACRKQREICAEAAQTKTESVSDYDGGFIEFEAIDKDSILNAPLATEKEQGLALPIQ